MMRLGVHVSVAGGWLAALDRAKRLNCNTMQIFSRSPRGGSAAPVDPKQAEEFDRERRALDIAPLAVHSPYIINLAAPDRTVYGWSRKLYQEEYRRCTQLKADYLVTHVGSHKGHGEVAGIARVSEALNRTLEAASQTMILLENTAGSGQGLGYSFEQLAAIRDGVDEKQRVGICLDTAHLFAAGFPIQHAEGLDETLTKYDRIIGLERLRLMHLNDSKAAFDSRVDRHWHIGDGQIGLDGMRGIVTHPKLQAVPFILETPKKQPTDDPRNLACVRRWRGIEEVAEIHG